MNFRALMANREGKAVTTDIVEISRNDLMDGDVTVEVDYSTVNYKDGLAVTGAAPIIAQFPLIPGIDLAGTVVESSDARFSPGDKIVANSWGLSQTHFGGYAEYARVPGDWLVKLPETLSTRAAMAIGTAGYTAMLCILAIEDAGVKPEDGDIVVTGAAGGVGSVATAILSDRGYRVVASTGRPEESDYLTSLGASEIIDRATLSEPGRPIQGDRWAGAVDSVGSHTLANVLAQSRYDACVTACGLAQGADLPASVLPFILRNVRLVGIDSVNAPQPRRERAWARLGTDLDLAKLEMTAFEIGLGDVAQTCQDILQGKIRGRAIVDVRK